MMFLVIDASHYPTGNLFSDCQSGHRSATTCGNGVESFIVGAKVASLS